MRLELTRRGDYGIRAMVALAHDPGVTLSGNEIANRMGISHHFVTQVMGDLVRARLVNASSGRYGGYRLAGAPEAITMLAVVEAIEGDTRRRTCVLRSTPCSRELPCQVHHIFAAAQDALINQLSRATLADALHGAGNLLSTTRTAE